MAVMLVMIDCHQLDFAYMKEVDLRRALRLLERIVVRRAGEKQAKLLICSLVFLALLV